MPRLSFALISVLAHVAAQETKITDPAAAASPATADGALYELMKAEYLAEGCEDAGFLVKRSEPKRRLRGAHP